MKFHTDIDEAEYDRLCQGIDSLHQSDDQALDLKFYEVHNQIFLNTDCLSCAICCKHYSPIVEPDEIVPLNRAIGVSSTELFEQYIEMDHEGDFVFKTQPCPMLSLSDHKCKIYDHRPRACRQFPHTNHSQMKSQLQLLKVNIKVCPAALDIARSVIETNEE